MVPKTVTYTDYNGTERTETFYFNLTKAELTDMELSTEGGMQATLQKIVDAKDQTALMAAFKHILKKSYGVKSPDGRRFMKSDELFEEFSQTEAYSIIFMSLISDEGEAAKFVSGVIPPDLAKEVNS